MAEQTKNPEYHIRGTAKYAYLNKPDTKFKAEGVYKVDLIVDAQEAEGHIREIQKAMAKADAEAKKKAAEARKKGRKIEPKAADLPFYEVCDEDGNETGEVIFRMKSDASGVSKKTGKPWRRTIPKFDAKGQPSNALIYGGSKLVMAVTLKPWVNPKLEYGVKIQIEAVQILDLVTGGVRRSAAAYGFGQEEGYSAENEEAYEDDEENETNTNNADADATDPEDGSDDDDF